MALDAAWAQALGVLPPVELGTLLPIGDWPSRPVKEIPPWLVSLTRMS